MGSRMKYEEFAKLFYAANADLIESINKEIETFCCDHLVIGALHATNFNRDLAVKHIKMHREVINTYLVHFVDYICKNRNKQINPIRFYFDLGRFPMSVFNFAAYGASGPTPRAGGSAPYTPGA